MNTFIKKTFIFILPVILILSIFEFLLRTIPNDYSLKKKYLDKNSEEIEILVLGSSHSFRGINPEFFSYNSFNASNVSQHIKQDCFIFNKYKDDLINLKYIVLPISYFSLFKGLEDGIEHWRIKNYNIYFNSYYSCNIKYYFEIFNSRFKDNVKRIKKYYRKNNNSVTCTPLGFSRIPVVLDQIGLDESGKAAALRHGSREFGRLEKNILLLATLIADCNERGVEVVLFTPPAHRAYRKHLSQNNLDIINASIQKLCNRFNNVSYFYFLDDSRFENNCFSNADHLNQAGAKKLTLIINELLKTIKPGT